MKSLLLLAALSMATIQQSPVTVEGRWKTPGDDGEVSLERCGTELCGRLRTSKSIGATPDLKDTSNIDANLRSRLLKNLLIVKGLHGGPIEWKDGEVYNPNDGRTYKASLVIIDATHVRLRGCIFFPLCKSETWTRIPQ